MTSKFRSLVAVLICLCACQVAKAADIYVTGNNLPSSKSFLGKVDTATGSFQMINANIGSSGVAYGLAWNPNIASFNILSAAGVFNTMDTNGNTGTPIATGLQNGPLGYDSTTSTMYSANTTLRTINTVTGAQNIIGQTGYSSIYGVAPVGGTVYGTGYVFANGANYGSFNTATGAFTPITAGDQVYSSMLLVYDGTTLYGLTDTVLYTINPATGAYSSPVTVSGIPQFSFLNGASFATVPEPSTYALAAIATGVMAAMARRRKARKA